MEGFELGHLITPITDGPRVVRIREAIARYRIGKTKLYAMINAGTLPSVKVGGTRLIPIDALEALIVPAMAAESHEAT
jgi:excisionase family DNA binding protein